MRDGGAYTAVFITAVFTPHTSLQGKPNSSYERNLMNTTAVKRLLLSLGLMLVGTSLAQTDIRWFVGLGSGSDQGVIAAQEKFVEAYNASQDEVNLKLEIVDNDSAYDVLATQIAAGNPPDIVGPMGVRGRDAFPGAWLDLTPLIEANSYDLSDFDPALVDFYAIEGEGQLGIPFAVFPSYISYNKDLFDEAGLAYPPAAYGEPYVDAEGNERPWNYETLRELALELTVDVSGNTPNDEAFDPDNVVQWGYGIMYTDLRGRLALFGADNLIDDEGNAVMSQNWRDAVQWYHDAMWTDYFYPNGPYGGSDLLAGGNWFESGNLAMAHTHLWYQACCMGAMEASWDIAPMVATADGTITAKLHGDTFGIPKGSQNAEAAFDVLTYMLGDGAEELANIYGGMPARLSLQDGFFGTFAAANFPDQEINWQVAADSLGYPDQPNHEAGLPGGTEATDAIGQFYERLNNEANLDIDAELEAMLQNLQRIYDANQ